VVRICKNVNWFGVKAELNKALESSASESALKSDWCASLETTIREQELALQDWIHKYHPSIVVSFLFLIWNFLLGGGHLSSRVRASDYIEFIHNIACSVHSKPVVV